VAVVVNQWDVVPQGETSPQAGRPAEGGGEQGAPPEAMPPAFERQVESIARRLDERTARLRAD
jgi:hypothetical protein